MHGLNILSIGLSAVQARECESVLNPVLPGLHFTHLTERLPQLTSQPKDRYDLALLACQESNRQGIAFLNSYASNAGLPLIALVERFDPIWVNHLLASGANRVVPFDQMEHLLPDCINSLRPFDWKASQRLTEKAEEHDDINFAREMKTQMQKIIGAQNFLESVLNNLPALLVVLDVDGRIIFFNRHCEEVSGYASSDVQGRFLNEIFLLSEEKQEVQEAFEKLKQGLFPIDHQNAWLTKDGKTRQIQWSNATALLDVTGKVNFIVGMGQDITDEGERRRKYHQLEARFERVFRASPIGIGLIRFKDLLIIEVNDSLLALLGWQREKVIGKAADVIGLFPDQGIRDLLDFRSRQGQLVNREWRLFGSGRRSLSVLVSLEIIEWDGESAVLVMMRDISERVRAEERIRRLNDELESRVLERTRELEAINREKQVEIEYRKAFEMSSQRLTQIMWEMPDVVAIAEIGGRLQYLNKAGRALYKLGETESVTHMSVYETYPPSLLDKINNDIAPEVFKNGFWHGEIELMLPDGNRVPVLQTILAHRNTLGEVEYFSTIIRDITEEKLTAEKITHAYQAEKSLNLFRATFFSMTSHQFRTPLSTIHSSAELLEHYSDAWDREKRLLHLRRIQEQVQVLNKMLNDILDVGRLEMKSDDIELEKMDVCVFVERVFERSAEADADKHRFQLECAEGELNARLEPHLFDRVLDNLLSNAAKYSPPGTLIEVKVYSSDLSIVIEIIDAGIGIPEDEIPLLFQPFFRARNTGGIDGSGLGLMIVRQSLELVGGEVTIESHLNAGTCVTVRIPLLGESE
jgi:PAS domain S-box-containing protein